MQNTHPAPTQWKQTRWRTMWEKSSPKTTRPNTRNHYGKRDAEGGREAENIGDEADGRKNVRIGGQLRRVNVGRLAKHVNTRATRGRVWRKEWQHYTSRGAHDIGRKSHEIN